MKTTMTPVEIRNECSNLIKAYRGSWHRGPEAVKAAATALKSLRLAYPWLIDQVPNDIWGLAMRDAA
jgi:hypothetical protein